jgi:hypothetical protein
MEDFQEEKNGRRMVNKIGSVEPRRHSPIASARYASEEGYTVDIIRSGHAAGPSVELEPTILSFIMGPCGVFAPSPILCLPVARSAP